MSRQEINSSWPPEDNLLREALEKELSQHFGSHCSVRELYRQPYVYRTSFPLEELVVGLENGSQLRLLCKGSSWNSLTEAARKAKPKFLHDPLREIETYRRILAPRELGTPIYYGSRIDAEKECFWLFVEKVEGRELYQVGEFALWKEVARWLAGFHAASPTAVEMKTLVPTAHLIRFDGSYYRRWMKRALVVADAHDRPQAIRNHLERLEARFERLLERLAALPTCFIHGEFYASNILVQHSKMRLRVAPVDWELAGVGPCLIDLAALVAGKWTPAEREALALAYREVLTTVRDWPPSPTPFLEGLDACRLLLAIQWLGWSTDWTPPREHSHDWLSEALNLADKLGI